MCSAAWIHSGHLNQKSRKNIYFSFIHSYINYGNIAWAVTSKTKLKKISTDQKKADRAIFFADCHAHPKPLILEMNARNAYQINMYQNLILLYKTHIGTTPLIFFNKFSKINDNYLTSSKNSSNYSIPKLKMKLTNFTISRRVPILWNTVLDATLKEIESLLLFKVKIKEMHLYVITSFRSFNNFKFNVISLNCILLFSYVIISDSPYYS